ncbi:MAG: 6,7-dimethyl-8-ribityllumazine synthase [Deltaproteobacteria bacterium]|nr:6,7-dimethyl-8-ribityllumazine synthase [Deltaproteobacteria bacterium]
MATTHPTSLDGAGLRVGVVVSRFNQVVTERLLQGALDSLRGHGVADAAIEVAHVPGAFELPLAASLLAASQRIDAVVCLGAIVQGETPHFDMIAPWVVAELGRLSVQYRVPMGLGVLTTHTLEQALERAGGRHGNKGVDAAEAALELANLGRRFA